MRFGGNHNLESEQRRRVRSLINHQLFVQTQLRRRKLEGEQLDAQAIR